MGQSAGPNTPAGYSISGDGIDWGNLSGVLAIDNNPAYADLAQFPTCNASLCYYSNIAEFTSFGFTIPLNATITGIIVNAMERVSSPGGGIRDSMVVLTVNGAPQGNDKSDPDYWLDTPTMNTYGGASDTWGYNWTVSEVNDGSFGVLFRVTNDSYDQPASLDYLSMTIHYQTGTGISSQTSSPWNIGFKGSHLDIHAEASVLSKGVSIEVFSSEGKKKYSGEVTAGKNKLDFSIDASTWLNGLYVVHIVSKDGQVIQRKALLIR